MAIEDVIDDALDDVMETYGDDAFNDKFFIERATELAMENLPDEEWTGDEDQWDEIRGITARRYLERCT